MGVIELRPRTEPASLRRPARRITIGAVKEPMETGMAIPVQFLAELTALQMGFMTLLTEVAAMKGDKADEWLREFEDEAIKPLSTGKLEGDLTEKDRDAMYGEAARKISTFADWAAARLHKRKA